MICLTLLVTATYAWYTLSTAPVVNGVATQIGSNGSLEMALLNDTTFLDPSLIQNEVGDSAAINNFVTSNQTWGNIVDLTDASYGLQLIDLMPARLNVAVGENGQLVVSDNMLLFPEYSADGRLQSTNSNSFSAVYRDNKFTYSTAQQGYGVRAIGSIPNVSAQESSLVYARSAVRSYTSAAISTTKATWKANGSLLLGIYIDHYINGKNSFDAADVAAVKNTASDLMDAIEYMEMAIRQGVVGYIATTVNDASTFRDAKAILVNMSIPLSMITNSAGVDIPANVAEMANKIDADKLLLTQIVDACDKLQRGCEWDAMSLLLGNLIDADKTYFNERRISLLTSSSDILDYNLFSIIPGSGPFSTVTEFAGEYNVFFTFKDKSAELESIGNLSKARLVELAELLDDRNAAGGQNGPQSAELNDIYGFAIDLAFRCNAVSSSLQLQTEQADRIEGGGENPDVRGEGSFMSFSVDNMTDEQIVTMIDAVRIGFVDNRNNLLAVAKLATSEYSVDAGAISAPLYLYEFSLSTDGGIEMGERREDGATITSMPQNEAVVITAIVWIDGDYMDNSLASITQSSMTGKLNLQFSSSAELHPATTPN